MSGALLVDNKLHHEYWRGRGGGATISYVTTAGFEAPEAIYSFGNALDDIAATKFRTKTAGNQVRAIITFQNPVTLNGFAVYGHNLTRSQGITIKYDTDTSGDVTSSFASAPHVSSLYGPTDNLYTPFGATFTSPIANIKRLQITTHNWNTNNFISILSAGMWLKSNIDISTPFIPPSFTTYESAIKKNNKGDPFTSDVTKVPQKIQINLQQFSEDDLYAQTDPAQLTSINGLNSTHGFVDYLGYFMSQYPFFFMYNKGAATDSTAQQRADQQKLYFCTIDRGLQQPKYSSPTLLNWKISAIGYMR